MVLASYADAVIYVVKADATPYTVARHCIQRLQNSNTPVAGVVLNQFDPARAPKYGGDYYQYSGYYDYYGYSSSGDGSKSGDDNVKSINSASNKDKPRVA